MCFWRWSSVRHSSATTFAQTSGIAGVVKDSTGAVMPGVTVKRQSGPHRTYANGHTDAQGQYKIVDLRPGTYTVTFTLTGFSTVKREGDRAPRAFTATVNADLRVGALEETVTVSGASPVVDMQNVIKRQVVAKDTIDAMPTSKNWSTIGVMTIGVSSNQNDVGGSAGEHQNQLKAHGGSFNDRIVQLDGLMNANMACNYSCTGISTNDASTQELSYEFGAISAETGRRRRARQHHSQRRRQPVQRIGVFQFRQRHHAGQQRGRRPAATGDHHRRQHPQHLRYQRRVGRADHEEQAVVLHGPPLLGLRDLRTNTFYEKEPVHFRVRRRTSRGRGPKRSGT